jgi:hypothetical protein
VFALDYRNEIRASNASNVGDFLERIPKSIFEAQAGIAPTATRARFQLFADLRSARSGEILPMAEG